MPARVLATTLMALSVALVVLAGCGDGIDDSVDQTSESQGTVTAKQWTSPPAMQLEQGKDYTATIHTNKGDIVIDLDEQGAPKTVNNFVFLANEGFYTNVPFHRIAKGFVIQTGDPTGTGRGGPGYRFEDEPVTKNYTRGTLAMANAGPNTNGSQFFICLADLATLPKNYTIFGTVTSGMDVVDAIAAVPTTLDASGREQSKPLEPVTMTSVDIETK
jgi:cyclophilin family peptidyl-prolyl cis-trans isomerase